INRLCTRPLNILLEEGQTGCPVTIGSSTRKTGETRLLAKAVGVRLFGRVWRTPPATRYSIAVAAAAAGTFLRLVFNPLWGEKLPLIMAFPAVAVSAWFGGFWPGLVTTLLSALAAEYLWMPPVGSLAMDDWGDVVGLLLFVAIGGLISGLDEPWRRAA